MIHTPAALTFADGTSLTLTAQAGASAFRGWRIDGSLFAVNPLQFVVTGDRTVTAVYHAPAPTVTAIVPAAGSALGGSSVTLRGSGLRPGVRVYFGGILAPDVTIVDDSELRVTTPAGTGTVLFSVVNDDDLSAVQCCFAYISTVVLDSLSPSRGLEAGGTVVAITGDGVP